MAHPIYRVRAFEHVGAYAIRIVFDDQTEQVVDFRPVLAGELYGPSEIQPCSSKRAWTLRRAR